MLENIVQNVDECWRTLILSNVNVILRECDHMLENVRKCHRMFKKHFLTSEKIGGNRAPPELGF